MVFLMTVTENSEGLNSVQAETHVIKFFCTDHDGYFILSCGKYRFQRFAATFRNAIEEEQLVCLLIDCLANQ